MKPWGLLALALCAACPKPKFAPMPAPAVGWFCYEDDVGVGACYRTETECRDDLVVLHSTATCAAAMSAACLSYTASDGTESDDCVPGLDECQRLASFLSAGEDHGQSIARAGTVTPCAETK